MNYDFHVGRQAIGNAIRRYHVEGLYPLAPTNASTQATGAGATVIRVNSDRGVVSIPRARFVEDKGEWDIDDGEPLVEQRLAQVDTVLINATAWIVAAQFRRVVYVAYQNIGSGALAFMAIAGAAAATAVLALYPTDAQIKTAIGDEAGHIPYIRLYGVLVERTADTALTVTYDLLERPLGLKRASLKTSAL